MLKGLFSRTKQKIDRAFNQFVAAMFVASQLIFPMVAMTPVHAANELTASDHEGQLSPSGTWSNGNITTYKELDDINFRFTVDATTAGSGEVDVRYTGNDGGGHPCLFFQQAFALGAINNTSGVSPMVTTDGTPWVDDDEFVQTLDISFAGAGEAVINYTLTLSDEAGDCNGSSQHSTLSNGDTKGNFKNIGNQNVPVPANDVIELASIVATKYIDDDGDGQTDRAANAGEWSFSLDEGAFVDTDSNGQVVFSNLDSGTYVVTEESNSDYDFLGVNGTNCVVSATPLSGDATVTAATTAVDAECNFSNGLVQQSTLILEKTVVNDDGGTLDQSNFPVMIDGNVASWGSNTIDAGTYVVSETQQSGYAAGNWGGDCDDDGNVTLEPGETKTCTITNNDNAPTLTLKKVVNNLSGGNANADDWKLKAVSSGGTLIDEAGGPADQTTATTQTFNADAGTGYTLSEYGGPAGYTDSDWDCDGGDLQGDVVTLALDEDVICTITNSDQAPQLTIIKSLTTDNGGTKTAADFLLHLTGGAYNGLENFSTGATPSVVSNVAYTLSETEITGYANNGVTCQDDDTMGVVDHPVTLNEGQHVTCTISNNDIAPKLTVTKYVTSDDGGTLQVANFPLYVGGISVTSGQEYTSFNAGDYFVTEDQQDGYDFLGFSGECLSNGSITLEVGGVYTCTLTNDDVPAKITVTKEVTNDDGGDAVVEDFDLKVNTTEVDSGVQNTFNGNLPVTISEQANVNGYTNTDIVCYDLTADDDIDLGDSFTTKLGHEYDCTVTNDDNTPELTLVKVVYNDFGQADSSNSWTLSATPEANQVGATTLSGDGDPTDGGGVNDEPAKAGVKYTLSEAGGPSGYSQSSWQCTGGSLDGDELTLALGDDVTCSITNRAQAPTLTVIKNVINDDGGNKKSWDFTMIVDGTEVSDSSFPGAKSPGTTVTLDAGSYSVSETGPDGYADTYSTDCTGTIAIGESKTCTITNDDIAPVLRLKKTVINDNGGDAEATDWRLKAQKFFSNPVINEYGQDIGNDMAETNPYEVVAGTSYILSESGPHGYDASNWQCDGGQLSTSIFGTSVKLGLGEDVTCSITNDDKAPKLKLIKLTYPDDHYKDFDFEIINEDDNSQNGYHVWNRTLDTDDYSQTPQWDWIELETAGTVTIEEDYERGWKVIPVCFGNELNFELLKLLTNPAEALNYESDRTVTEEVGIGDTLICVFVNIELGDLKVTKFHDRNQNGYWDKDEEALPGWDINLKQEIESHNNETNEYWTNTTDEDGEVKFKNLLPSIDTHFVEVEYELSETLQPGWHQSNIYCEDEREELGILNFNYNDQDEDVLINPGEKTRCYVGNYQDANYTITKTNDAVDALVPGQSVNFTIEVTAPADSGTIYNAKVYDLIPEGLTYVNGSWSAVSTVDGDQTGTTTPEPDYSGPEAATWELGDLTSGETVTLTYTAVIDDNTPAGTYTNVAWTDGCEQLEIIFRDQGPFVTNDNIIIDEQPRCDRGQEQVFGNCVSEQPEIILFTQENGDYPYPEEEEACDPFVESEVTVAAVLGEEETVVLAETGTPAILAPFVGLSLIGAAVLAGGGGRRLKRLFGKLNRGMITGLMSLTLMVLSVAPAMAATNNVWKLEVATLASTTTASSVDLSYSVASTNSASSTTVELEVDGPGSNDVSDSAVIAGSASQSFEVDLPVVGEYEITVSATGSGTLIGRDTYNQTVARENPPEPTVVTSSGTTVTQSGNTHTVAFTVPAGSDAETVQIYASTDPNSQGELVGEIPATPGALQSFVHNAANAAGLFFTIRLVDGDGNASTLASSIPSQDSSSTDDGVIDEVAAVDDQSANDDEGQEQGATDDQSDDGDNTALVIIGLAAVAGALYYVFGRRSGLEE